MKGHVANAFSLLIWMLLPLAGCSDRSIQAVPENLVDKAQIPDMPDVRCWADGYSPEMEKTLVEAFKQRRALGLKTTEINILAISGGGADGAYGAGLLCGWTEAGDRPVFDVVTGISTGALISPFAFLGKEYDKQLAEFYTCVSDKDIYKERSFLEALSSDAAADTSPLKQLIAKVVTNEMLSAISAEYAKGRRLFVGSVNLDAQRPVVWNMGKIASYGTPQALELFRKVLLASASIPAAFPPQYIDVVADGKHFQEMHVDGGAMNQVFHIGKMLNYDKLKAELNVADRMPRRTYVIRNCLTRPEWKQIASRFIPIAGRAVSTLLKANASGDLYQIWALCKMEGIDFNLSYIPDDFKSESKEMFNQAEMKRLFDIGFQLTKTGKAWKKAPPGVVQTSETH